MNQISPDASDLKNLFEKREEAVIIDCPYNQVQLLTTLNSNMIHFIRVVNFAFVNQLS